MEECYWNITTNLTTGDFCRYRCEANSASECVAIGDYCSWDYVMQACVYVYGMGGCYSYTTISTCEADPACDWDNVSNRCVISGAGCSPATCYLCYDQGSCESSGCFWDEWSNSCVPRGGGGFEASPCLSENISNRTQCEAILGCIWIGEDDENGECDVMTPCEAIDDEEACINIIECSWDDNENKCMDRCELYDDNETACNDAIGCVWNTKENFCEPFHQCNFIPDQITCDGTPGCHWDPFMGECIEEPFCHSITNEIVCNSTPGCAWTTLEFKGNITQCAPFCMSIKDEATCNATHGCEWDDVNGACFSITPCMAINISNQTGINLCNALEACWYNQYSPKGARCEDMGEAQFRGGVDCSKFYDQQSCDFNSFGECVWMGQVCVPIGGTTAPVPGGPGPGGPGMPPGNCSNETCYACWNPEDCEKAGCEWDYMNLFCTPPGENCDSACGFCGDEWQCLQSKAGCEWDYENNICVVSFCDQNCGQCKSRESCFRSKVYEIQNWRCVWDEDNNLCKPSTCDEDCFSCFNQSDCETSSAGCEWDEKESNPRRKCKYAKNSTSPYACDKGCVCDNDTDCWNSAIGCNWIYGPPGAPDSGECTGDMCMFDCTQCFTSFECSKNPACEWDDGRGVCDWKGYASTCATDCWSCSNEIDCNNSNATFIMWTPAGDVEIHGCEWAYDPFMNKYQCMPKGQSPVCENTDPDATRPVTCEACLNESSCVNGTHLLPYMGPWAPAMLQECEWVYDPWKQDYACHPAMGPGGPAGGCPDWDFTSEAICTSHPGCKWEAETQRCKPDEGAMDCSIFCPSCENEKECESNPICKWITDPKDPSSGWCVDDPSQFNFGADCNEHCFDCFSPETCEQSPAGCRWIPDPMGGPGWCDLNTTLTCDEDCFQCFDEISCLQSNNSKKASFYSTHYEAMSETCANITNAELCNMTVGCFWNESSHNCETTANPSACEWDNTFFVCKPRGMQVEICFIPGDEDNDGLEDCADPDCAMDPFCGYGVGPGPSVPVPPGAPPGGLGVDCWQWDEMNGGNQNICENYPNGTPTGCKWHLVPKPLPPHCFDGIQDFDEEGIDCGGIDCPPCDDTEWKPEMEGLCDPAFVDQFFSGMQEGPPIPLPPPDAPCNGMEDDADGQDWINICDLAIRDTPNVYGFIIHVTDWPPYRGIRDLVLCNYMYEDCQNRTGKYYYYIDTDNNESTGCNSSDGSMQGFEYKLGYVVNRTLDGSLKEIRIAQKCKNGTWSFFSATLSGKKDEACMHNGVYLGVEKADIGNPKSTIRICAATANETRDENSPVDITETCSYYTPGTIDFFPPDCSIDPTACGSGFDPDKEYFKFEECVPTGIDEDQDGLADCDDPDCFNHPECMDVYDCSKDVTAPDVIYNKVKTFSDMAIVTWTTSEPTTGMVQFFYTNNTCQGNHTNITQFDDPTTTFDDFRTFHDVALENLSSSTTYYYKLHSCDKACDENNNWEPNCAVSACLNFTTTAVSPTIPMDFDYTPPTKNPTDPLGNLVIKFAFSGTCDYQLINFDKVQNFPPQTNVNIEFTNNMSSEVWCLRLIGVDIFNPNNFDLSVAFQVNNST